MPPRLQPSPFTASPPPESPSPSGPYRAVKHFALALLCAVWVVLGLIGHDPWKAEDATSFGVTWDMMNGQPWLTPTLVGEPFAERPPLVYVLAAITGKLFTGWLEPYDAARVSVAILLATTLVMISLATRELAGRSMRWVPVLIFVGAIGLWDRAHQLSPEVGLMSGLAVALYGFTLAIRRPAVGGAVIGAGAGLAFLAAGFVGPAWIALALLLLPVASAQSRTRRLAVTAAIALATAGVLMAAWPVALAVHDPSYLAAWWDGQELGRIVAWAAPDTEADPLAILKNLPWFTWPASVLVAWTLYTRARGFNGGLRSAGVQVAGVFSLAVLLGLLVLPQPRMSDLMMLIVPLAVLGALEVDTLPRGFSGALDWFGILTFGLLGALAWWTWWDAYAHGMSMSIARMLRDTTVGYRPSFHGRAVAACVFLTLMWLALVRPARRSNRRAVLNWAAGATLLWAMFTTIWLPYLDSRRSYRAVAEEMGARAIPKEGCVASRNLGDPQRAVFYYFAGIRTVREEEQPDNDCDTLLVQYSGRDVLAVRAEPGWRRTWEGHRHGDDTELYVIYTREPAAPQDASRG